jgi:putative membrane protein
MKRLGFLVGVSAICCFVANVRSGDPVKLPTDNEFLIKVATCNHAVIAISKMAESQGSTEVKAFAADVGKDHTACKEKLADLFKTRKIGVVAGTEPETKAEVKRLGELKGTDFDREYLKWFIKEHRSSVRLFENQIKAGKDDDLRAFAKEALVGTNKHLQKAEELAKVTGSK